MVIQRLKNMFIGREQAGNLYQDMMLRLENASIALNNNKICIASAKETIDIALDKIESIDFIKTQTKETALMMVIDKKKWMFVFQIGLPGTLSRFYGTISEYLPKINKWKVVYVCDAVCFSQFSQEKDHYQEIDPHTTVSLIRNKFGTFIRVNNQYIVYRKGDFVESSSEFYIDQESKSFSWCVVKEKEEKVDVFRIYFNSFPALLNFISSYISENKDIGEEKDYFEKMEIENLVEEKESESESDSTEEIETEQGSEDEYEYAPTRIRNRRKTIEKKRDVVPGNIYGGKNREKNRALAVGKESAFISRGASIGCFKREGNELIFSGGIKDLVHKNKEVEPKKMLLTNDNSIIFSDSHDKKSLYKLDLETEKIAETWNTQNDTKDFFSSAKTEEGIPINDNFLGISKNSIFRVDPRSKEIIEGKQYSTNTKFFSGDANARGEFAIGAETGDIRLYDSPEKRAKTLLPGLGDPVIGVFISPSGKYIICTCKTYLMLLTSEVKGINGFKKSLGKDKPIPKKLIIRPEHLNKFNGEVNFTSASISTDKDEKFIVVSTGEWVVVWNIEKVLRGEVFSYYIKKSDGKIVSNSFTPGDNSQIVLAMNDDIQMIPRKALKKPETKKKYREI